MTMRTRLTLAGCLLTTLSSLAQTFPVLQQTPAGLHWYRLKTPHFRVLYPEGFEQRAQETAHRLEQVYEPVSASLERKPRPISVLLQNQTTINNGYVTLLPRKSEFFTATPQAPSLTGTNQWLDLLAVHEYRHVVQYEKALQGFTGLVHTLFGNYAQAGLMLGVPDWFAEGDAVGTETLLTRSGRGRIPNFDLGMRANRLSGQHFNYAKAVAGSYRDNVPDHYVLGYFLSTNLKNNYGINAWSSVLNRYYAFPLYPFSFSNSLKSVTKYRVEELYRRTMADLDETLRKQQENLRLTPARPFAAQPEKELDGKVVFTNYQYPQYLSDSSVIAVKSGLGDITQLVALSPSGKEQKLFVPGLFNDSEYFSAGGNKACWLEYRYQPRWNMKVWSEIRVLDLKTGKLFGPYGQRFSEKSRYTAVSLSPDGSRIVAVENTPEGLNKLVIIEAEAGGIVKVIDNPANDIYLHPRWKADNQTIIVITQKRGEQSAPAGKTIQAINYESGTKTDVLPLTQENISHPQPWGDYVLYNSPQSGIDNIYAVDTRTGQTFQVTSRPFGAYQAAVSPDQKRMVFQDFMADRRKGTGFRIAEMALNPAEWVPATQVKDQSIRYFGPLLNKEPGAQATLSAFNRPFPKDTFAVSRYRRLPHALNLLGFGPAAASDGQNFTASLESQDLLATTQASVGYSFNQSEKTGTVFGALSYQGLFPIFDLTFQSGTRTTSIYIDRRAPLDSLRSDSWQYNQLSAGIRLPFVLTQSKFRQNLNISAYYNLLAVKDYNLPGRYYSEVGTAGSVSAMTYGLSYSLLLKQSKRDVAPRWGITLSGLLRHTPFGGSLSGQQFGLQGNLFLPGIGKHHSIRLRGGFQQQNQLEANTYRFSGTVFFPRGHAYTSHDQLLVGSAEYRLPLASPHWTLGRWLYIQRVVAAGFVDAGSGKSMYPTSSGQRQAFQEQFQSVGADVSFTFNVLRFRQPFSVGVRTIYNVNTGQTTYEPLVLDIGF